MEIVSPDAVSQSLLNSKDFLTQTASQMMTSVTDATSHQQESLVQKLTQVKETFTQVTRNGAQTTEKVTNSLSEVATQNFSNLADITKQAVGSVVETAEKAKDAIANGAQDAVHTVSTMPDKVTAAFADTTSKAVAGTTNQLDLIKSSISQEVQTAITLPIQEWMDEHWLISSIFTHPLLSLFLLILFIFVVSGFLRAFAKFAEETWSVLLKSPWKIGQWTFGFIAQLFGLLMGKRWIKQAQQDAIVVSDREQRLSNILTRLDAIRQEQDVLLQELSTLLKSENSK